MRSLLPFIVIGVATGSIYAIAGMGLVLTFKTSGIFNFAHGAVGTAAAYIFFELNVRHGWPWPMAGLVAIAVVGPALGLVLERLANALTSASSSAKIVATVGLLLSIEALAVLRYGPVTRDLPQFLPTRTLRIGGVNVGADQLIVVALSLAVLGGLAAFFRASRLGLAMQGVVDDPDLMGLTGTNPTVVRRWAWAIGSAFAALSGVLLAPVLGLDALVLTLLVVQAFGAAAVGGFSSIPRTYAGGLAIGVVAAVSTKYVATVPALQGFPPSLPFVVLFGMLVLRPAGLLVEARGASRQRPPTRRTLTASQRAGGLAVIVVLLLLVPRLVTTRLPVYTHGLVYVVLFLSLGLLVRTSRQVSLCQLGFAAVGGAGFSLLVHGLGLPWPLALFGAGLLAIPVGAFIAIPAIRLSGVYLALATFGFGVLLERMGYTSMFMFGHSGSRAAPRPHLSAIHVGTDTGYYYVVLTVVFLAFALVIAVERSRLGQLLRAMADSPVALSTHGTNVNLTRLLVFCISAFMAGIGGALLGPLSGAVTAYTFGSVQSLVLLAVLAVASASLPGSLTSALAAAAALAVVPSYVRDPAFAPWLQLGFGVSALGAAVSEARHAPARARLGGALLVRLGLDALVERATWRLKSSPVAARREAAAIARPIGPAAE